MVFGSDETTDLQLRQNERADERAEAVRENEDIVGVDKVGGFEKLDGGNVTLGFAIGCGARVRASRAITVALTRFFDADGDEIAFGEEGQDRAVALVLRESAVECVTSESLHQKDGGIASGRFGMGKDGAASRTVNGNRSVEDIGIRTGFERAGFESDADGERLTLAEDLDLESFTGEVAANGACEISRRCDGL